MTINNPNGCPVAVTSISASSSHEVNGCAAGTVTTAGATNPSGVIPAGQFRSYSLQAVMNADASDACKAQTFTLRLTAQLVSAAS